MLADAVASGQLLSNTGGTMATAAPSCAADQGWASFGSVAPAVAPPAPAVALPVPQQKSNVALLCDLDDLMGSCEPSHEPSQAFSASALLSDSLVGLRTDPTAGVAPDVGLPTEPTGGVGPAVIDERVNCVAAAAVVMVAPGVFVEVAGTTVPGNAGPAPTHAVSVNSELCLDIAHRRSLTSLFLLSCSSIYITY